MASSCVRDGSGGGGGGDIKMLSANNLITVAGDAEILFFDRDAKGRASPKMHPSTPSHIRDS